MGWEIGYESVGGGGRDFGRPPRGLKKDIFRECVFQASVFENDSLALSAIFPVSPQPVRDNLCP